MPKMKTHRGAKKRFGITARGRLMRQKGSRGHNKMKKKRRQLFAMRDMHPLHPASRKAVRRLLPYGVGK